MKKRLFASVALAAALFSLAGEAQAQKTIQLFNGKDLSNWDFKVDKDAVPAEQVYSVKEGVIHITGQPFGYMYTKEKYRNYKLHLEYRWPNGKEKANSGVFLQIAELKNPFPNGIECNLMGGGVGDLVLLGGSDLVQFQDKPGVARPAFPVVPKHKADSEKPGSEWNSVNIFVKEGAITVYINGVLQNMGNNPVKEGHIGLQSEGKEVQFRNVTLTPWGM